MKTIDFRSDAICSPTEEMKTAFLLAEFGDNSYGPADPVYDKFLVEAAELLGKEAAAFAPSGTSANQCTILSLMKPGE